jgi:TonB family protein
MKKFLILIAALFAGVCSLEAQQKNYAQMSISYAVIDETDYSEMYAEKGAFLAFYKSELGDYCMANVWPESQSYGQITDWVAYHYDATDVDDAYDEFYFNWHFANTYDEVTGVASCCLLKVYREDGSIEYALGYTLEDGSDAVFSGIMEGQMDDFIKVMIESQGNGLLGVWAAQTIDVLNYDNELMATIYPVKCDMIIAMGFDEDNKGSWFEKTEGESEEGEFSYVYDHPVVYVSMDGEEFELQHENDYLTYTIEEDGLRYRIRLAKVPPMENEEENDSVEPETVPEVVPEVMPEVAVVEEEIEEEAIPFQLVEEKPSFQGGDANQFSKWVSERLVFPEIAKENGIFGRVVLQFTVEKDGSITNIKVLRGVDPSLDSEAVRVVSNSPKWTPGKQRGRTVRVTYTFPVIFQFSNSNTDAK